MGNTRKFLIFLFFSIGIFFIIGGLSSFISEQSKKEERIYIIATISDIVKVDGTNPEDGVPQTQTYVEFYHANELYELLLNTSSSKYEIGDEVSIYYYPDNMTLAYSKSSEYIMLGYVGIGLIASITSAVVFFLEKKKNK